MIGLKLLSILVQMYCWEYCWSSWNLCQVDLSSNWTIVRGEPQTSDRSRWRRTSRYYHESYWQSCAYSSVVSTFLVSRWCLNAANELCHLPIVWTYRYKDGEEIKPDDARIKTTASPNGQLRLSIDEVTPNDCGAYRAVATNELGKSIANTAVVVTRTYHIINYKYARSNWVQWSDIYFL